MQNDDVGGHIDLGSLHRDARFYVHQRNLTYLFLMVPSFVEKQIESDSLTKIYHLLKIKSLDLSFSGTMNMRQLNKFKRLCLIVLLVRASTVLMVLPHCSAH